MSPPLEAARIVRFGTFELDLKLGELRKQGLRIKLQEKPFRVLSLLLEHPGDVVTREQFRERLWAADTFVEFDHSLSTAIKKLRDALGDTADNPRFIETVPLRGYRFIPDATLRAPEDGPVGASGARAPKVHVRSLLSKLMQWGLTGLVLGAAVASTAYWIVTRRHSPAPKPLIRVIMAIPPNQRLAPERYRSLAMSPDGKRLAYLAYRDGIRQLFLRPMNEFEASPIMGTEGAMGPFFSPDGQWIGFFADGKLKKVPASGGTPVSLCEAPDRSDENGGAAWSTDNFIIFAENQYVGLSRISASGGSPKKVTVPKVRMGDKGHIWPEILPGGKAVVFTILNRIRPGTALAVQSLEGGEPRILIDGASQARYAPTGHLVYLHGNSLMAVPFDVRLLRLTGAPVLMQEGVRDFTFSMEGSLIYLPAMTRALDSTLVWVSLDGQSRPIGNVPQALGRPNLSPDGRMIAANVEGPNWDLWTYDTARKTLSRLTAAGNSHSPIWAPDGKRIAFGFSDKGPMNLFWRLANGDGESQRLTTSQWNQWPTSWSPDGKTLAFQEQRADTDYDIWVLPLGGERKPHPFVQTPFSEWGAVFSPDGNWVAYVSDESGKPQIYVTPFPGPGGRWQVSNEGGLAPLWAREGLTLFYRNFNKKIAMVKIKTSPAFAATRPIELFEDRYRGGGVASPAYDTTPDGKQLLMIKPADQPTEDADLRLELNWFEELRDRTGYSH